MLKSMRQFKIYTKTGDKGTTGLYSKKRLPKDDMIFECLGTNDELSCNVGLALEYIKCEKLSTQLVNIQSSLQLLNSNIASDRGNPNTLFPEQKVTELENWIDEYDSQLPVLKNFILPSGGLASCQLHICRTICRRAERRAVSISELDSIVKIYLNRLSDYFFMAARYSCKIEDKEERIFLK